MRRYAFALAAVLLSLQSVCAINLNLNSPDSIKAAASTVAYRMVTYYHGNESGQSPGVLPEAPTKYYWWETGEMFGALMDYWYYTGDTTYNDIVKQGMLFQTGPNNDYMPPNQTADLGNDDQVFWAFSAMTAAEYKFPNPDPDQPQWLALAQAVFNTQALRWDTSTCGGGLRWQIYVFNQGYNYKNAPTNAGLFNLAARIGAYTHNQTYFDWAEKAWDWMEAIGMISPDKHIWDGTDDTKNCTDFDHTQWSYSYGMAINGAAVMWNNTNSTKWGDRAQALWNTSSTLFFDQDTKVMTEFQCEMSVPINCDTDQLSFKAPYSRFLAASTKVAPWLYKEVQPYLAASASAAAAQCIGTPGGDSCGTLWTNNGKWDGSTGVGQQMSALQVIQSNLILDSESPVSNGSGGTSQGDPSAGVVDVNPTEALVEVTTGDRAGAGILTAVIIVMIVGGVWWGLTEETSSTMPLIRKH